MDNLVVIRSAIKANVPVLLEGATGTGKTYTIMELAKEAGKTLHVINVSGELTVDSILGQQTLVDGTVLWSDGVLTAAMKKGDWVLFDEMNTALPEVLTVINGVLDDSRSVTLPNAKNERVCAHEEFRFIGTQNPAGGNYAGTSRLNDALLNRMVKVQFGYMDSDKEAQALKKHTKLADNTIQALVSIAWETRYEGNSYSNPISTRDLVKVLRLRDKGGMSIKDAMRTVLADKYDSEEFNRLRSRYDNYISQLTTFSGGSDKDPLDHIRSEFEALEKAKRALREREANLRTEVKRELLNSLLTGNASNGEPELPPKDF